MGKILSQMNRLDTPLSVDSLAMEFQASDKSSGLYHLKRIVAYRREY
jgi:hypothetical protein